MESRPRLLLRNGAHLFALSGLALAQPLYAFLETDASVLSVYDVTGVALVVFALAIALVPALALVAVEALASLLGARALRAVHLACIALLAGLFEMQARTSVGALPDGPRALGLLSLLFGAAVAVVYSRFAPVRATVDVLAVAVLAFIALFLFVGPAAPLLSASDPETSGGDTARSDAPVVMVVFDELPLASLLDRHGRIDSDRHPAFGRLARDGTWFRNTTAVEAFTPWAIPAIMDGRYPRHRAYAHAAFHPHSVFTMLGSRYRMHVDEPITRVCPNSLCPRPSSSPFSRAFGGIGGLVPAFWARLVPEPLSGWAARRTQSVRRLLGARNASADTSLAAIAGGAQTIKGDPTTRFERFVRQIRPGATPTLHLIHVLLPHRPWSYLPTGQAYPIDPLDAIRPENGSEISWRRHLLQLEHTDRLLGSLLARLDALGLYDRSLIAVTADHGMAFGEPVDPRAPTPRTIRQLAPVPFLLKRPGQHAGSVSDTPMETIDELPTIADALGIEPPAGVDGASGFGPGNRDLRRARMTAHGRDPVTVARSALGHGVPTMHTRLRVAGAGADERRLYSAPGFAELVGRRVPASLPLARGLTATLDGAGALRDVDVHSATIPAAVTGAVRGGAPGQVLAIALNGRVAAVSTTFRSARGAEFAGVVAAHALRDGFNEVALLVARRARRGAAIVARVPLRKK